MKYSTSYYKKSLKYLKLSALEFLDMTDVFERFKELPIKEYKHWTLYLHKKQRYLGRVYLWAKREDAVDFMDMNEDEKGELFEIGGKVRNVLNELFRPDLFNYAALGNVATHLHLHIIPRYKNSRGFEGIVFEDGKWGKNYAPYNDFEISEEILKKLVNVIKQKLEN